MFDSCINLKNGPDCAPLILMCRFPVTTDIRNEGKIIIGQAKKSGCFCHQTFRLLKFFIYLFLQGGKTQGEILIQEAASS